MPAIALEGKTILQILPRLDHGGVERGVIETASGIIAAGGRALVVSEGGALVSRLLYVGAEHIALPVASKNPFRWPVIRKQLRAVLAREAVDLVHLRSRAPAWIALPSARRARIPVVSTIHGRFLATSLLKRHYNRIMVKADRVIAISRYIEDVTLRQFPQAADRLTVIARGVDVEKFDPASVSPQRIVSEAQALNIPDDRTVIMLPARPSAWKGQSVMIEALAKLKHERVMLVLVGAATGSEKFQARLTRQIEEQGLARCVRLAPMTNDMAAALMLADIVAMPSVTPEPFGRVAVEAQAMGRPVLAFAHGGASESVLHRKTGWLAEPASASSLAEGLEYLLGLGADERQALADRARAHICAHFTTGRMVGATLAVYDELLSGKAARS